MYDGGYYNSLVVTLGDGDGDNWWCVLFPPLCLVQDNETTSDVEYKFFINRIIEKFK
ncbi:MAG: stage II sporulation protein R [Clostridium sp.]|nr:MAG: stage II sporulation protein R [Clostridium sp.]